MVKITSEKGQISITSEVLTYLAGVAATSCFGVNGMIKDVKLEIRAQGNQFEKTAFRNVELIGTTEKNFFKECDMKGYHFTEKE